MQVMVPFPYLERYGSIEARECYCLAINNDFLRPKKGQSSIDWNVAELTRIHLRTYLSVPKKARFH